MKVKTCLDYPQAKVKTLHPANLFALPKVQEIVKEFKPSFMYFNGLFGMMAGHAFKSPHHKEISEEYERIYMEDPKEGKTVFDILKSKTTDSSHPQKVMIALHGVTGHSNENYMQDMGHYAVRHGYHFVVFHHFAPFNEKDCKLIDFIDNRHLDDVIGFIRDHFREEGKDGNSRDCELFLTGFSLGGNHVLKYLGSSAKNAKPGETSPYQHLTAVAAVSAPFDVLYTGVKMKTTRMGFYNKFLHNNLHRGFKDKTFFN
eukprot:CAMPEP_0170486280 /NCGR_PEP_ID=MMETSP0208-20121228/5334_1 /TAXON_ID=197538 /ORGANISM="Strombidium inclinatum, Strain S3" /LENGTH=257 /DNA_ID=CAMNT_0010760169 /DNA_START=6 /DNA_END=779 /DNA_ORIENTATION=-